jgi:fumarate reductase flavoprotein subunit
MLLSSAPAGLAWRQQLVPQKRAQKQRVPGGATHYAEGIFAVESPVQKRANISSSKDDLFRIHMYFSHWTLNPRLVRALINISGDSVDWLEKKGVVFNLSKWHPRNIPNYMLKYPVFHRPENWGTAIINALAKDCQKLGVQILYETRATKLLTDKGGAVVGVEAKTKDNDLTLKAKSVIIATGGYGGNKKLMKKWAPQYDTRNLDKLLVKGTHPGERIQWTKNIHTGDGISMAFDVGADHDGLGILMLNGPNFVAGRHGWALANWQGVIRVNKEGERFADEGTGASMNDHQTMRQPDQICFTLFDDAFKKNIIKNGFGFVSQGKYGHNAAGIEGDLEKARARDDLMISDSWDEIEKWIGTKPGALKATINEYNAFCDKGHDDHFVKDPQSLIALRNPPYYACKMYPGFLVTIGGIRTNHRMEVLNKNQQPIKGLYAVGISIGGWCASTYNGNLLGNGSGFPIYSGRIAGENAAKYSQ